MSLTSTSEQPSDPSDICPYLSSSVPYYLVTVVQPCSENLAIFSFNYDHDEVTDKNGKILSDDDIKKSMKSWSLKDFQEFYGFTHLDSYTGDSK